MLRCILLFLLAPLCQSYLVPKPNVNSFIYNGDIAPLNHFDPLQITSNMKEQDIKYLREAELQHSRIAMASFVALVACDILGEGPAINNLYNSKGIEQFPFWFVVFCFEFSRMGVGWKNPFTNGNGLFKLEDNYQPGNIFKVQESSFDVNELNKELSNGRLAMIGTAGFIAQELVTQHKILG